MEEGRAGACATQLASFIWSAGAMSTEESGQAGTLLEISTDTHLCDGGSPALLKTRDHIQQLLLICLTTN